MSQQIRPTISLRYGRISQPVKIPISPLLLDNVSTVTTVDIASGSSTLTVKNIGGFAVNQILLLDTVGNQGSEIIKTHASTVPSGNTITLASNTLYPHSSSTKVTIINFDQVEISTAATTAGSKSVLTTATLVANALETLYNDTVTSSGYYFARFKNSITSAFSPYSDAAPLTGYTMLSARSIIDRALADINKVVNGTLTDEYGFMQIDNCQMECLKQYKRWSFMQSFDTVIGTTSTGNWKVTLPANCDDQNTTKSIYTFRIGREYEMQWVDKEQWNDIIEGIAYTTLASNINVSDATITLTDSTDFDDAGSALIGANTYSYTANNRSTGVLTLSAVSTNTNTAGQDAFLFTGFGYPVYWTTYGGTLYHYPPIGASYNNRDYRLDYYKSLTQIQHDSDTIVLPDPVVVQYYLSWKFLLRQQNGLSTPDSDRFHELYLDRRTKMEQKESLNRSFVLNPNIRN